jgi:hypothetical protein
MSFTVKEVEEKVSELEESGWEDQKEYGYSNIYEFIKGEEETVEVPGLGKLEYVEDYGGEGSGDDYWVVFKIGDQFFRKDGWYASYDGGELDGELYEVKPTKVSVTEYQKV